MLGLGHPIGRIVVSVGRCQGNESQIDAGVATSGRAPPYSTLSFSCRSVPLLKACTSPGSPPVPSLLMTQTVKFVKFVAL